MGKLWEKPRNGGFEMENPPRTMGLGWCLTWFNRANHGNNDLGSDENMIGKNTSQEMELLAVNHSFRSDVYVVNPPER